MPEKRTVDEWVMLGKDESMGSGYWDERKMSGGEQMRTSGKSLMKEK